jgi:hypothetical protein
MATIRSYTTIEQSKKLAKILPIDSADMYYYTVNGDLCKTPNVIESEDDLYVDEKSIPCWSLAALLEILPHRIDEICELDVGKLSGNDGWYVCYDGVDRFFANSNLIDACYEMILKLNEQKLI